MAEEQQLVEDESLSKLAWGYVGVGVLWIALVLTGITFERLGLTTTLFSGVLPGEVGILRQANAEHEQKLKSLTDQNNKLSEKVDTLTRQKELADNRVEDLRARVDALQAAATPAQEDAAAPDA
ncbi:MAG: hypothetical protein J4F42_03635 [Desulfurellaceae bacterium]|nr:hypothetical protein [Desulfurellaceae bacterium]